jgi:hypothetical protein
MPLWLVKATWREDEAEASEKWEVNAETARDAVKAATTHLRFQPHHVEVRLFEPLGIDKRGRFVARRGAAYPLERPCAVNLGVEPLAMSALGHKADIPDRPAHVRK